MNRSPKSAGLFSSRIVRRRDWAWTLIPFAIWIAATQARPWVLHPYCAVESTPCTVESLPAVDRLTLGLENPEADGDSYFTQNLSGVLAVVGPVGWSVGLAATGAITWPVAATLAGTDLIIFAQTAGVNGMLTEISHAIARRPRPFVYSDPHGRGRDPQNYTSFYSGHTSFAAAAGTSLVIALASRGAPLWVVLLFGSLAEGLVVSTALLRTLAGRHFLTDVVCGAIAGTLVAIGIARAHRTKKLS